MNRKLLALLLAMAMLVSLCACGGSTAANTADAVSEQSAPAADEEEADEAEDEDIDDVDVEEASSEEVGVEEAEDVNDFTASNAAMDFSGYKEMLKGLTTELPITEDDVTLSYFFGFEGTTLNYLPDGTMGSHQVWTWLEENTGVKFDLRVVDKTQETDQFNLMIASGDYTDIVPAGDYAAGVESAYEEDIFTDLTDLIEENMPNYWTIINSDKKLLADVTDGNMLLAIYALKDQVANPGGIGTFVRMDWLEDLNMEVPETYEELTDVLTAFKSEKGASEPMALFNTVSMQNGILMGGFGSLAELSANGMGGDFSASFYQEDGKVIYGATADGTRKFLSWLHELYTAGLIDMDHIQSRETNPFSDYNAGMASDGTNGYIFTNQPFGGEYSKMAASSGDEACNWWPVRDVAENKGDVIHFYEEVSLIDMTSLAITTNCEAVETALQFLDYGYSYDGALLLNFGFQKGDESGQYQTWNYDADGEPMFDEAALKEIAEQTNIVSGIVSTKDLAGIVYDTRLSFSFGERELACFDAWSAGKDTTNILGSATVLNAEESEQAATLYSDILTYVATCTLQFINGDKDVDGSDWDAYVKNIEGMGISELTEIIQGAYDRANA